MAQKPETKFIAKIHGHIHKDLYHQKMHTVYCGGTADMWYSGSKGDLWVEYKWSPLTKKTLNPNLSALQDRWLSNRFHEGRNVAVIVGLPQGAVLLTYPEVWSWRTDLDTHVIYTPKEIADWINNECIESVK